MRCQHQQQKIEAKEERSEAVQVRDEGTQERKPYSLFLSAQWGAVLWQP